MRKIKILSMLAKRGETFTFDEAYKITHLNKSYLKKLLYRLEKDGVIERISKGKYLIIPLHGEKGKYTLHEFIIGSLLIKPYAISYWSALNYYGFTEQIPLTVFLQTTSWKKKQEIEVFGVKYKIVRIKNEKFFGITKAWIENNQINITDREKTIIDCFDKPKYCGGIGEVIKALKNRERINLNKLSKYAIKIGNSGVIRRLGFLSDFLGIKIDLPEIKTRNYLLLDPTMPKKGKKNAKWRLIINISEAALRQIE